MTPTTYFPSTIPYRLGFYAEVVWNTDVSQEGPTGRTQRFKNWTTPKRRMHLSVMGLGGSGSVSEASNKTVRQFLYTLGGRYLPFYIFNPRATDYDAGADPQQTYVGIFNTTFPMVCPFKGGTITKIYKNGSSYRLPGHFTVDASGPGGETRIATVDSTQPSNGDVITVDVTGAYERIPVRLMNDVGRMDFDFGAAVPPTQYQIDVEEDFG